MYEAKVFPLMNAKIMINVIVQVISTTVLMAVTCALTFNFFMLLVFVSSLSESATLLICLDKKKIILVN